MPLEHVLGVARDEQEARQLVSRGAAPGTGVPGVITAGTFHEHGERVFWDVHHADKAIAISLRDESYAKLVIDVDDPDATITAIEAALGERDSA